MNSEVAASLETTPWESLQRWLVMTVSVVGVALSAFLLIHTWQLDSAPLKDRLNDTIGVTTECAMLVIAWLIAVRAGRNSANLAMALAIVAAYFNGTLGETLAVFGHEQDALANITNTLSYILGAALFIRASQKFPRDITGELIARTPTAWGQWKPTRIVLTTLLKPWVLWPVVALLSLLDDVAGVPLLGDFARLVIIGLGVVYFWINFRAGDAEVRRKVLWFMAWAAGAAAVSIVIIATRAAIGADASPAVRAVLSVTLNALNSLVQIVCVTAAIFYAGAISPSLIIRKTVVFGMTTALLLFFFASIEVFLHHEIVHLMHVTDTFASSMIGGAFGLTFHPVKHYFEHLLKRMFGSTDPGHG